MRILGFSQLWPKLKRNQFTTFRMPRRDRDWQEGEQVMIVLKPRSKNRRILGSARIIRKEKRRLRSLIDVCHGAYETPPITRAEARTDGFKSYHEMSMWLHKTHGIGPNATINKLTLVYMEVEDGVSTLALS